MSTTAYNETNFVLQYVGGSSLAGVTDLWSLSKTHFPSLVLVQPRKTSPCWTERLLMGRKESKQTKKQTIYGGCGHFGQVT